MLVYFVIAPCGLKYTAWGSLHDWCSRFQGLFLTETCNHCININLSDIPCPLLSYDPSLSHAIEPAQCSRISYIYWNCQLLEGVACTVIFIWGFFFQQPVSQLILFPKFRWKLLFQRISPLPFPPRLGTINPSLCFWSPSMSPVVASSVATPEETDSSSAIPSALDSEVPPGRDGASLSFSPQSMLTTSRINWEGVLPRPVPSLLLSQGFQPEAAGGAGSEHPGRQGCSSSSSQPPTVGMLGTCICKGPKESHVFRLCGKAASRLNCVGTYQTCLPPGRIWNNH